MIYANEFDPDAARWLKELFPSATIDTRSIADVQPADVIPHRRAHFFAGIGGWEYALQLIGWPADLPVWTGSCPCQPFSVAGKGKGEADPRHLWPEFRRLIAECLPSVVFGEQVASRAGREWLSRVRADLEALGYAVGAADLCAAGVGAPHIRQRLYWGAVRVSDTQRYGLRIGRGASTIEPDERGNGQVPHRLPLPDRQRRDGLDPLLRPRGPGETDSEIAGSGSFGGLSVPNGGQCNGFAGGEGCDTDRQASGRIESDCEPECYCESSGKSQRLGYAPSHDEQRDPMPGAHREGIEDRGPGGTSRLADSSVLGRGQGSQNRRGSAPGGDSENERVRPLHDGADGVERMDNAAVSRHTRQGRREQGESCGWRGMSGIRSPGGFWSRYDVLPFTDGKARRVEPGTFPLVNGLPRGVGYSGDPSAQIQATAEARPMRLKGYGNAIVPELAATFIISFIESIVEANV